MTNAFTDASTGGFDIRLRHDLRRGRSLFLREDAENIERGGTVVDRDDADLADLEPIEAGLRLVERRRLAERRGGRQRSPGNSRQ